MTIHSFFNIKFYTFTIYKINGTFKKFYEHYIIILQVISDWNFFKELNCVKIFLDIYSDILKFIFSFIDLYIFELTIIRFTIIDNY